MFVDSASSAWQDFPDGKLTAGSNTWTLSYTDTNNVLASQRFYKVRVSKTQLIMTLVLDRSGSMASPGLPPTGSGGGAYLPGAVSTFVSYFDDANDEMAMVSFATTATVDVPMRHLFKSAITTAVNNLTWSGSTFAQGGLTNALVQNNSVFVPPGQNVLKVVVFFTDGLANIVQDVLSCSSTQLVNFGGYDSGNMYGVFDPVTGNNVTCSATQFRSAIDGTMKSLTRTNITADAQYRTIQVADDMRADNMFVYSIGLGSGVDMTFLAEVANATNSPTYDPTKPTGLALIANNPSDLLMVFQQIASMIVTY